MEDGQRVVVVVGEAIVEGDDDGPFREGAMRIEVGAKSSEGQKMESLGAKMGHLLGESLGPHA